jgi:O-antigen/teichoic acid export membrane protein
MQANPSAESPPVDEISRRGDPFVAPDVSKNLKSRSVRGASILSMSRIANLGLRFIATGILARILAPEDFGLVAMTAVISGFFAMFMDVGLTQATIQRPEINHRQISNLFWINVALGLVIGMVFALLAPAVAAFYRRPEVAGITQALACSFVIGGFGVQHQALLQRNMRFKVLAAVDVLSVVTGIAVGVAMAISGRGYWSLVAMTLVIACAKTAGVWIALRWIPGRPSRAGGTKEMVKFGGDVFGFSIVNYFSRQADNILIGKFCGAMPLAIYEKAYSLLLMPVSQINGPLAAVTVPALSRLQNQPERYRSYYLNAIQVVCSIGVPAVLFITLFADQVVEVWLGPDWRESARLFRLLAVAALVGGISNPVGWLLISSGLTRRYRILGLVNSAIIVVAFAIGLKWGAEGVAAGYSIAMALNFIPFWAFAVRGTPVRLAQVLHTMAVPLLASIPAAALAWWVMDLRPGNTWDWPWSIGAMAVFMAAYAVVLLFGFKKLSFFRRIAGEFRSR